MKAILMSIKPKWIEKIANGEKTVEVRKTVPKCGTPFKVYMYATKEGKTFIHGGIQEKQVLYKNPESGNIRFDYPFDLFGLAFGNDNILSGKVVGEFVCDNVEPFEIKERGVQFKHFSLLHDTCLSIKEIHEYAKGNKRLYGLHISDLKIYDKQKELSEFWTIKCNNRKTSCGECDYKPNCVKDITRPPQSWQFVEEL